MRFKLLNCVIKIHFSFLLLATLALYVNNSIFLITIISAIIHELGHIIATVFVKISIKKIDIRAFNFEIEKNFESIQKTVFILIAGPIFNLLVSLLAILFNITIFTNSYTAKRFLVNNLFLFFINILPICNLDGGQILYYFLLKRLDAGKVNKILEITSLIFSFVLFTVGIYILIKSKYNYSLLLLSLYLIFTIIFKNNYFKFGN